MIPVIAIRADNAFAIPLIREYAKACRTAAANVNPSEHPNTYSGILDRATELDRLAVEFERWQSEHPDRVRLDRMFNQLERPGAVLRDCRKRLTETAAAYNRDVTDLRESVAREQRARREAEQLAAELEARRTQALPREDGTRTKLP